MQSRTPIMADMRIIQQLGSSKIEVLCAQLLPASSLRGIWLGYSRYLRGRILDVRPDRDTAAIRSPACMDTASEQRQQACCVFLHCTSSTDDSATKTSSMMKASH